MGGVDLALFSKQSFKEYDSELDLADPPNTILSLVVSLSSQITPWCQRIWYCLEFNTDLGICSMIPSSTCFLKVFSYSVSSDDSQQMGFQLSCLTHSL